MSVKSKSPSVTKYAQIAVELPIGRFFTYSIPPALGPIASPGKRVLVEFGKRTITGYILALADDPPPDVKKINPLIDVLDEVPIFDEKRLKFFRWLSSYYFVTLGEALSLIHPGASNVKSQRFLKSAAGAEFGEAAAFEREILEAASKGISMQQLLRRFKSSPVYSTVERLKKNALLNETVHLRGGGKEKLESFYSIVPSGSDIPQVSLRKSPAQAKLFTYLLEKGEVSLQGLKKDFRDASPALRELVRKGLVRHSRRQVLRDPLTDIKPRTAPAEPNEEQKKAIESILNSFREGFYGAFLLYGVTGSGKTLVYLKIIEEVLKAGKKALIITPEIALTPWPAAYLSQKFPGRVAMYHSGLSEGERTDEWGRIVKGAADIVVGARSALFVPLKDLGIIIVDEEHETSYKQEDGVRYNARDTALMLGHHLGITVVLGSATPSVETFYNALKGKLKPLYMKKRVGGRALPKIEVTDMRSSRGTVISERLRGLLSEALLSKDQSLLFLNRRGFSNSLICKDCGHCFSCLNCAVTLTMHKTSGSLTCHYCDMSIPLPDECPGCKGTNLTHPGAGTEKVSEEIKRLFPDARIERMDRDSTRKKGTARKIIEAVEEKKVDILIGTQMVSKGHHFPGITVVGIISGDTSLNIPDFRSSERTFQLITQAAGRAGRGEVPGTVIVQTLNPDHYCFKSALNHDFDGFYEEEISLREETFYPPFSRLCNIRLDGLNEGRVTSAANNLKRASDSLITKRCFSDVRALGPAPALIPKIKGRYRWQMLVKGADLKALHFFLKTLKGNFEASMPAGIRIVFDMDPVTIA